MAAMLNQKRGWRPPNLVPVLCSSRTCCSWAGASPTWQVNMTHNTNTIFSYFHNMNRVFQFIHVLVICSYVENSSDRFRQLNLLYKLYSLVIAVPWCYRELTDVWTKSDRRIQTASITGIVVFVSLVQRHKYSRLVVLHHVDADVDMSFVAVVDTTNHQISVKLLGMDV